MDCPIFISYSRKDTDLVHSLAKEIEGQTGIKCWIDLKGIESGEEFEDKIIGAIDSAQVVLFMLSNNAMKSEYAKLEVNYAKNSGKKIVPIILDGGKLRGWFLFKFGGVDYINIDDESQKQKLFNNLCTWLNVDITQKATGSVVDEAQIRAEIEAQIRAEHEVRMKEEATQKENETEVKINTKTRKKAVNTPVSKKEPKESQKKTSKKTSRTTTKSSSTDKLSEKQQVSLDSEETVAKPTKVPKAITPKRAAGKTETKNSKETKTPLTINAVRYNHYDDDLLTISLDIDILESFENNGLSIRAFTPKNRILAVYSGHPSVGKHSFELQVALSDLQPIPNEWVSRTIKLELYRIRGSKYITRVNQLQFYLFYKTYLFKRNTFEIRKK